jgi:hypothetical protein
MPYHDSTTRVRVSDDKSWTCGAAATKSFDETVNQRRFSGAERTLKEDNAARRARRGECSAKSARRCCICEPNRDGCRIRSHTYALTSVAAKPSHKLFGGRLARDSRTFACYKFLAIFTM